MYSLQSIYSQVVVGIPKRYQTCKGTCHRAPRFQYQIIVINERRTKWLIKHTLPLSALQNSILVTFLGVSGPPNSAHLAVQVTLLPTYSTSSPIDHNPPVTQAIWINSLENAGTDIDVILAATFARIDNGGLVRVTRSGVIDVDLGAAGGVVIGVGRVVH